MGQYALLVAGLVIGGITGAGLWALIGFIKGRAARQRNERGEQIIASVEEKWVDAENLVRSYRSGRLNMDAFRESLDEKIESIDRIYKPGIHQLDIFFVKYTEKMIEEYRRMTETGASPVRTAGPSAYRAAVQDKADIMSTSSTPLAPLAPSAPVEIPAATMEMPPLPRETGFSANREDEQIIAEMTEAAATDSNMQLESFLEMEPRGPETETIAPVQDSDEITKAEETKGTAFDADAEAGPYADMERKPDVEPETMPGFEDKGLLPPPPPEEMTEFQSEEPLSEIPAPVGSIPFQSLPEGIEIGTTDGHESETIIQPPGDQFSFSGRVSSEQESIPVPPPEIPREIPLPPPPAMQPPPQHPFALPSRSRGHRVAPPPAPAAFTKEEVVRPATIYDVEAETIIVDRSAIMGAQRPAPAAPPAPEEKKSIGITGEDVSDAFDAFFGPSKK
jgi:hypothetical protein